MSTFILIAGGTASGKTTIAKALALKLDALLIQHDRYYKDIAHPKGYNFDAPEALDSDLLAKNLHSLKEKGFADLPIYDFPSHSRLPQKERVEARSIIIIEGILVLQSEKLRQYADLSFYVEAPDDIRLIRRIKRDVLERGRETTDILEQYLNTVRPMHCLYVEPSQNFAHDTLDGCAPISESLSRIIDKLKSVHQII